MAVALLVGAVVWSTLDEADTLTEQRDALVSADAFGLDGGPEFLRFETAPVRSGRADVTAVYTQQSGFDIHVFTDPQRAESEFNGHLKAYAPRDEAQQINTYDASERCFAAEGGSFCFGFDGTRAFRSYTWERSDPDGLEALMLLRTARKHWYRFFSPEP